MFPNVFLMEPYSKGKCVCLFLLIWLTYYLELLLLVFTYSGLLGNSDAEMLLGVIFIL